MPLFMVRMTENKQRLAVLSRGPIDAAHARRARLWCAHSKSSSPFW